MKERLWFLIKFYLWLILVFSMGRLVFLIYNQQDHHTLSDFFQVVVHGWRLDVSTIGYLAILPWLFLFVSLALKKFNFRKFISPYFWLISILIGIILVVDTALYEFWGFKLDATVFNYIDSPKNAAASVPFGFIIVRVCCIVSVIALLGYTLVGLSPKELKKTACPIRDIATMILIGGLMFIGIRGGVDRSTANVGMAYFSNEQILNHAAINPCFSLFYSMGKQQDFGKMYHELSSEECEQIFSNLYEKPSSSDSTTIVLKNNRPNILLIEWEGFGGLISGLSGEKKDITPNFNSLIKEGIYFENYYSNSFRTDRGTLSIISGYPACPNLSIMKMPNISQTLPSFAEKLAEKGYETGFLYGGDINFTNMKSYLYNAGYSKLFAQEDFPKKQQDNAWGVNDEWTFGWLKDYLLSLPQDKPWHMGFLTLSSHEPWDVPFAKFEDPIDNSFAYTDHCLGDFIVQIKQSQLWENLLIIILPDHCCHIPGGDFANSREFFHCPMLWIGGAVKKPFHFSKHMNQSDVASTLLAQLGIPTDDFRFSRDVFSSSYQKPFAFSCFNDGFMLTDSLGTILYDHASQKIMKGNSQEQLIRGKAILQSIYDDLDNRNKQIAN